MSLLALTGDEAWKGGKGEAGECELMDNDRMIDDGDCPVEETDWRCWKMFTSDSFDTDRTISSN
jgi:hypothetical protein